ncbi:putative uncharacterized protein [Staphylococcus equorum subsp. equorum Mu2]|uniref:CDP-glycerol glycerophosphotransferase family protein n=1 Tax=Staphylococcus equorum TaxID=246432 RepID=UPI000267DE45|nr:CDP-glycerol glycerophosphotransferase family protein [Staphylococcus equorum]CCI59429.1 putative uncharacterized protein [Staphylococcus equorum subsp. equorum Mu2]
MNQYIFITSRLDKNHGGLTASMLNKVSVLNEKLNIKPVILTFHLDWKYNTIKEDVIYRYGLENKATFINMNEYFKHKIINSQVVKYTFKPDPNLKKEVVNNKKIEYYSQNEKIYSVKYSNNKLREIVRYSNGIIIEKITLDNDESLFSINYYHDEYLKKQDLYRKDQSVFESRIYENKNGENEIIKITLFDEQKIEFTSFDEFKAYFISLFIKGPFTYLIGEARSIDDSILVIKDKRVRKIFMTHSIHIRPDTDIIRQGNRTVLNNLNEIDGLVLLTESQKQDIIKRFGYRKNYFVIPHAIETKNIKKEKRKNKIVMISRLHEEKRINQAIQAFKQIVEKKPNAMLHIYGEGKARKQLQTLIDTLALTDNVKLEGYTHNIDQVLQSAECTLLTSLYEGFALVIQESIANGTPVISYDIKYGPRDMIQDGVNGYLVEDGNIDQLAECIHKYLSKNDQEKESFSKNSLEKAQVFSYNNFVDNWQNLFDDVKVQQERYKPSVKLIEVNLENRIYQLITRVKLNAKETHHPNFKFLFYKRSSLHDKENMKCTEQLVQVTKIRDNVFDISAEFNPKLFDYNDIYDLSIEIQENTQYHNIRVGNYRNNINLNKMRLKDVRPYFTKDYENISFDLTSSYHKRNKRDWIKYGVKKLKNELKPSNELKNNISKLNAIYDVPKSLLQYNSNKKSGNTLSTYQNLKQLHPILKKNVGYYVNLTKLAIELQKWEEAIHYINKAIENGLENYSNIYYIEAMLFKRLDNKKESIKSLKNHMELNKEDRNALSELANLEIEQKEYTNAKHHLNEILSYNPNDVTIKLKLKKCLEHLEEYQKIIELAEGDLEKEPYNSTYLLELANAYRKNNDTKSTAKYLERYVKIHPEDTNNIIQLIHYLEDLNEKAKAVHYYSEMLNSEEISLTNDLLSAYFYKKGQLEYDLNRLEDAKISYNKVIQYSKDPLLKKLGIGYVHEKSKSYLQAINAYQERLEEENSNAELHYKVATLLKNKNNIEEAIYHFEKALEFNKVRSPWHYQLALCYEEIGNYENAAVAYKNAIVRQQTHRPNNFRRLAYILEEIDQNDEALDAYNEAELFRKPSYMSKNTYDKHIDSIPVRYAQSYNYYEVEDNMIFYESMGGAGIIGNPSAMFDYLYNNQNYESFTHVWVINSFDNIPIYMRDKSNIIFVKKNSDAYLKYITKAKYLICNSTFSDYVVRKSKQKYLQTTHGIFYKTVGRDSNGSKVGVAGSTRNLLQATHIIAPNQFMIDKQKSAYSIGGIHVGDVAKVGYPRIDTTLNATEIQKSEIKKRMNIDNNKSVVLYAPTWRGETKESNGFDIDKLIYDLNALSEIDANILFRGHSITKSLLKNVTFPENITVPPGDISTNHLMSIVDVLISDYSSVFFDFIPTEKPIVHYIYDIEEYTTVRGLNLTMDELPGYIAENTTDLISSVKYSLSNPEPSNKYLQAKDRFCPYDYGESSEHVAKWFFEGDTNKVDIVPTDKYNGKALYLIGQISNTNNIDNLITNIASTKKEGYITSLSLKKSVADEPFKVDQILALGNDVNLLPHAGPMVKTFEEIIAIQDIEKSRRIRNSKTRMLYERAYQREKRRLFGDIRFDRIYNYEDEMPYWIGLYEAMKNQ